MHSCSESLYIVLEKITSWIYLFKMSTKSTEDIANTLVKYFKESEVTEYLKRWILTLMRYINSESGVSHHHIKTCHKNSHCSCDVSHCGTLPFSAIPQKRGYPLIGCMLDYYHNLGKTHWLLSQRSEEFGAIFKEKVGSTEIVFVSDLEAVETMVKFEGRHPYHFDVAPWLEYRRESGKACGILTAQGEDWGRMRRAINRHLLRSKHVADFSCDLNVVTEDFLSRLARIRTADNTVPDLHHEVLRWALESTGVVLFEKRLGCLEDRPNPDTETFIRDAENIMSLTQQLIYLPTSFAKVILHSTWKKHAQCWDALFSMAQKCVDEKISALQENEEKDEAMGGFLSYLLAHGSMSAEEVYANVIELMIGGIHSTTSIVQWLLYELSRSPSSQESLYTELSQRLPTSAQITASQMSHMPYLQAALQEALRLYPVAGGIPRILQTDQTLCGYRLPKGANVMVLTHVIGRSPDLFENPDNFCPDRWLQSGLSEQHRLLKDLAFGMGNRMCVGKRVGELEIKILLSRLSQRFVVEPVTPDLVNIQSCLLLQPDKPIEVRFLDRD